MNKPGNYKIVYRLSNKIIDPRETLKLEVYIIGFGKIGPAKISFYPSSCFFDTELSTRSYGLGLNEKSGLLEYGNQTELLNDSVGYSISIPDNYINDIRAEGSSSPRVSSETKTGKAPFEFNFKIPRNVRPGDYSVQLVLVYFNGDSWITELVSIPFSIRNFFQRLEGVIITVGLFAAVATILSFIACS